jgi:outer membrane protein assembly factor BamA
LFVDLEDRSQAGLKLSLHSYVNRGFDNYYGEGSNTSNQGGLRLEQDQMQAVASALLSVDDKWSVGPSLGLKARRENGAYLREEGLTLGHRAFEDSANPALGVQAVYDDRDSHLSSHHGGFWAFDVHALPSHLAPMDSANDTWQAQADWRQFQELMGGVVLAHRLSGGSSLGEPSYSERYTLGGTSRLRGFEDNRFRGRQFYCLQEELRVPVWKMISAATSVDLGDIGDGALGRPRRSLQAGLRAGIPPSYGMKARMDMGFGDGGERSLALVFGESF